jgi:hypothetical protein
MGVKTQRAGLSLAVLLAAAVLGAQGSDTAEHQDSATLAPEKPYHRLVEELQTRYKRLADDPVLGVDDAPNWITLRLLAEIQIGVSETGDENRSRVRQLLDMVGEIERIVLTHQARRTAAEAPSDPSISGTVTKAGSGLPITDESVWLYDSGGSSVDLVFTDGTGKYTFAGLPTGTYLVRTDVDGYFDELYDNIPCPIDCDETTGTPIAVVSGSLTSGIDFVLATGGVISGTVTKAGSGLPITDEFVWLYDSGGSSVDLVFTDGTGKYTFAGLPTGTYFVRTDVDGYFDELYDNIPCPIDCDETTGTPIAVTFGSTTPGIDFVLGQTASEFKVEVTMTGTGSGIVTSSPAGINCGATCTASFPVGITVWLQPTPAFGSEFGSWGGDSDCADGSLDMDSDKSCTADFQPCSIASTVNLPAQDVVGTALFEACNRLTAGTGGFRVLSGGNATFRAGNVVELGNGFSVAANGRFQAVIGPATP